MKKQLIKVMMTICLVLGFMFVFGAVNTTQASAAQYTSGFAAEKKCGKYYIKYNKNGLYKRTSKSKAWKKFLKVKNDPAAQEAGSYTFTSDGTYVYYGVVVKRGKKESKTKYDAKHSVIYRVNINGKGKKKIYNARHIVGVQYYYNNKVVYATDADKDGYLCTCAGDDAVYMVDVSTKKFTKMNDYAIVVNGYGATVTFFDDDDFEVPCDLSLEVYNIKNKKKSVFEHSFKAVGSKYMMIATHDSTNCYDLQYYDHGPATITLRKYNLETGAVSVVAKDIKVKSQLSFTSTAYKYIDMNGVTKTIKF